MRLKLIVLVFLIVLSSCQKENYKLPGNFFGNISALKNNSNWSTKYVSSSINDLCYEGNLGINFWIVNDEGFRRESLALLNIPKEKGSYKIFPSTNYVDPCNDTFARAFYATMLDDGDVLGNTYDILPIEDNYVTIKEYNSSTKKIDGSFQLSFVISRRVDPLGQDTLRFKNANFYTKVF